MFIERLTDEELLDLLRVTLKNDIYKIDIVKHSSYPLAINCYYVENVPDDEPIQWCVSDFSASLDLFPWRNGNKKAFYTWMLNKFGVDYLNRLLEYHCMPAEKVKEMYRNIEEK